MIIAYQTYRNEPVGIAQVRQSCEHDSYLYLTAIETKGEKRAAVTTVRNAKLRVAAKKKWGLKYYCCGFHFEKFYGQAAKGSAIVHHLQTFTTASDQQRKATIEDVRVVCANCHYILHLKNPPMGVNELKEIISQS
jgi:predicted HNH restriction endonuclease